MVFTPLMYFVARYTSFDSRFPNNDILNLNYVVVSDKEAQGAAVVFRADHPGFPANKAVLESGNVLNVTPVEDYRMLYG